MAREDRRDGVWLDFAADVLGRPVPALPFDEIGRLLVSSFDAPAANSYSSTAGSGIEQEMWPYEHFADHLDEAVIWAERRAPTEHPLLRYYIATGDLRCRQVHDVPEQFADRRVVAAWMERGRAWGGVQAQVALPMHFSPTTQRAFIVGRERRYSAEDMDFALRLQRLLTGLDAHVRAVARWRGSTGTAGGDAADGLNLTRREIAVLHLVATGLTASAVGRRLAVTEKTVQKHLEHVYSKLGVNNRISAVHRARTTGLLPAEVRA